MKAKSGKLSKYKGLCICEQGGISISTYYFLPTRNVFGRGASKEAGQLKTAFDRLFAVAECGPDLANPQKESVLLMAAEGHGFEETLEHPRSAFRFAADKDNRRKGPVAELKNSAAGFLVSKEGRIMEIAMKFAGTPPKWV